MGCLIVVDDAMRTKNVAILRRGDKPTLYTQRRAGKNKVSNS